MYLAVATGMRPRSSSRTHHKTVRIVIQVIQQRPDIVEPVLLSGGQEIRRTTDVQDNRITAQTWENDLWFKEYKIRGNSEPGNSTLWTLPSILKLKGFKSGLSIISASTTEKCWHIFIAKSVIGT